MAAVNPDPPPTEPPLTQTTGVDLHFSVHPRLLMNTNSQLEEDGGTTHTHTHTRTQMLQMQTYKVAAGETEECSLCKRNTGRCVGLCCAG